jgi:hypothetical protein
VRNRANAADWIAFSVARLNDIFLAQRETAQARGNHPDRTFADAPARQPGSARRGAALREWKEVAYPSAWTAAAAHWQLAEADALGVYLWDLARKLGDGGGQARAAGFFGENDMTSQPLRVNISGGGIGQNGAHPVALPRPARTLPDRGRHQ